MENIVIVFKDGSTLNAERNGDSFITTSKPAFPGDLTEVTVKAGNEVVAEFKNAEVVECASVDGRYWFAFVEVSEEELEKRQLKADIAYLAMMSDIEL